MSMEEFHCEFLELNMSIPDERFNKVAFFEAIEDIKAQNKDKAIYAVCFDSAEKPKKQHAHIFFNFRREGHARLRISYHAFGGDDDTQSLHMEDCAKWLGKFIKEDEVTVDLEAAFSFDKTYSPTLALPFPLLTSSEDLAGSQVTGVRIKLPPGMKIKSAILERRKNETTVYIYSKVKVDLKQFDLDAQLTKLFTSIMKLVTRTGEAQ